MVSENNVLMQCKFLAPNAMVPSRSRDTDAGYDLYSVEQIIVPAKSTTKIKTGIALSAPAGFYYTIEGRSGLGAKGIVPFRGIIDAGYTGQVIVILRNDGYDNHEVNVGDRIAQICLHPIIHAHIKVVQEFSDDYNSRGTAGFGSSGS